MADLYGWKVGQTVTLPGIATPLHVLSLWRDYVRQSGSVVMRGDDYRRLFGDNSLDDVLVWVSADQAQVASNIRAALAEQSLNIRSTQDIRKLSLALFDRSFALTYLLEAVAIAGALFGVACIYSGEALGRAREFGMLRHLGVQRHQVSVIFVLETAIMLSIAVLWSLALSKLLAWILIHRINPQSFHWSMDTITPWGTLLFSALAVLVLGVLTAWLATRSATSRAAVLAVREDW
jgi:putative ABC transport system permease protein